VKLFRASNQAPVQLGRELGRGGEGAVFPVTGSPNVVAKIYLKPPAPAKVEKLRTMARVAHPTLLRVAAWPIDLLVDEHGQSKGFLMPKVSAREDVHELYSPKSRKQSFPEADFRFVVRAATNVARAFAQVHAQGHVIGDVNHGNALVGRDGTVVLIDCDSFQILDKVRVYSCDVGVPLFTPPELQGKPFRGLRRSQQHDAFGLGIILFHMLYLGRHPFAGRSTTGDMPIERAIAESRFVYGAKAAEFGMAPPPGTLDLQEFGPKIAELFERTFAPPGSGDRPAATQWVGALKQLEEELTQCSESRVHYFHGAQVQREAGCCWCKIEQRTRVRLFGGKAFDKDPLGVGDVEQLWGAIAAVPEPEKVPELRLPPAVQQVSGSQTTLPGVVRVVASWALVGLGAALLLVKPGEYPFFSFGCFAGAALLRSSWPFGGGSTSSMSQELARAQEYWAKIVDRWERECSPAAFQRLMSELDAARTALLELPRRRQERISALEARLEVQQRENYLDQFQIARASFKNLRPDEAAMLASYGIETAGDVLSESSEIDGMVSMAAARELIDWAHMQAANYRFDPSQPVDSREIARLDEMLGSERAVLMAKLREGPTQLAQVHEAIAAARAELKPKVDAAWRDLTRVRESE
jgi:DNA-binding helix-hairpin-helix protein with protein kinase domain